MGFAFIWGAAAAEMWFLIFALGSVTGRCLYLGSLNGGCKGWEGSRDNIYLGLPVKGARYKDFVICLYQAGIAVTYTIFQRKRSAF